MSCLSRDRSLEKQFGSKSRTTWWRFYPSAHSAPPMSPVTDHLYTNLQTTPDLHKHTLCSATKHLPMSCHACMHVNEQRSSVGGGGGLGWREEAGKEKGKKNHEWRMRMPISQPRLLLTNGLQERATRVGEPIRELA